MDKPDDLARPWGERLRTWREEIKSWSQEEFVEQIVAVAYKTNEERGHDLGLRLVRRWECGEIRRPQGVYRRILAHLGAPLPRPAARSAPVLPPSSTPSTRSIEHDAGVDRREFLKVGTTAAAGIAAASEPWQRLENVLTGANRPDIHATIVIELRTRALFDLEESTPATEMVSEVSTHLDSITTLLSTAEGAQLRTRLVTQAGTSAALAGWLAFDQGALGTAQNYYAVAEQAADQAGDRTLAACVRTYRGYLADAEGNSALGACLLQDALDVLPRGRQPIMRAWLSARQAESAIALGDRDNALRAFDRAYLAQEFADGQEQPMWTRFFTPTRLDGMAVAGYARLNHPDMETVAARLLEGIHGCQTKVEQIALADLAYAYLERGDVERGADLGQRALDAISVSDTRVGYDRLAVIGRALAPYRDSRSAIGLRDQLMSTLLR